MPYKTSLSISNNVEASDETTSDELVQLLKNIKLKHPALNRLRVKLVAAEKIETAITSYDRMHHRHNRS